MSELDLSANVLLANSNTYPALGTLTYTQSDAVLTASGAGTGVLLAGTFHPLADYIIDLTGMADGEIRHMTVCTADGATYFRLKFTYTDGIVAVTSVSSATTTETAIGTIGAATEVRLLQQLRVFGYTSGNNFV